MKGTRIPVWVLVLYHRGHQDIERLLEAFPSLDRSAIEEALAYYEANRAEIERSIAENDEDDEH